LNYFADISHLLAKEAGEQLTREQLAAEQVRRIRALLDGCTRHQRRFVLDKSDHVALRCPRRAGKSRAMSTKALHVGESRPGSRILVISLTLKSTKENFWAGSPSGIFVLNDLYGLGLRYHNTDLVWHHQNGSRGRLAGAETRADIEYLRGAAAEADVVLIDECKSFHPQLLTELIRDVIRPGLMTRQGQLIMGGTPGLIPVGPFYEATCEASRVTHRLHTPEGEAYDVSVPTCWPVDEEFPPYVLEAVAAVRKDDPDYLFEPWSLHSWTIEDNDKVPHQWERAKKDKQRAGWGDDHPAWLREYLGQWVADTSGLVYAYAQARANNEATVQWWPSPASGNAAGLPPEDGPWHLVMGLDFGYEDANALVLVAYSERIAELRHVYDFKSPHLTLDQFVEEIKEAIARFGAPEVIIGDAGALGKLVIESLGTMFGLSVIKAEKAEKFDHIELLNNDFHAGRVKIIPGGDLEDELLGLQWDLSKDTKEKLARSFKLRESASCPNHLCDALLYSWRYCYHNFARPERQGPAKGTEAWLLAREDEAERRVAYRKKQGAFLTDGAPSAGGSPLTRETAGVMTWRPAR
jgi:hypothetical protein